MIVVQRGECLIAVVPEHPECHAAEHLECGGDFSVPGMIHHQPCGISRNPRPFGLPTGAVGIKRDLRAGIENVRCSKAVAQRYGDGGDWSWKFTEHGNALLQ